MQPWQVIAIIVIYDISKSLVTEFLNWKNEASSTATETDETEEINDLPSVTPQEPIEKCTWIKYDYRTVCPKEHDVDNPYWRIPENRMETLKYCPYCGKEIEVEE